MKIPRRDFLILCGAGSAAERLSGQCCTGSCKSRNRGNHNLQSKNGRGGPGAPSESHLCISDELLEIYLHRYNESKRGDGVTVAWQGGEPTLKGLGFFERSATIARKTQSRACISNTPYRPIARFLKMPGAPFYASTTSWWDLASKVPYHCMMPIAR
jgi:hypothetical protein